MPIYRADNVGSFLRPQEWKDARANPNTRPEQLKEIEDKHILRVLQRQKDLGFKIFTDGELRRGGFMSDFVDAVEGFDMGDAVARTWKGSTGSTGSNPVAGIVTAHVEQKESRVKQQEGLLQKQQSRGHK